MIKNVFIYKKLLEDEYQKVKNELDSLGKPHDDDKNNYDTVSANIDTSVSSKEDVADKIESMETRAGIEVELEKKIDEIVKALQAIEDGTYGICVVCGKEISEERLNINPQAVSCSSCYSSLKSSSKI